MNRYSNSYSRRQFVKAAGAAGMGAMLTPLAVGARNNPDGEPLLAAGQPQVPKRPFGKSGRQVSILSLGGMFDIMNNQLLLRQALRWGVYYWDTADCYEHGAGEEGFGKYFAKYPQDREKVFLVTKSDSRDPEGISRLLDRSLAQLNTSYIDLYLIHGISSIRELNDHTRRWAAKAKAQGKIKLFGFSAHSNMEELLAQAPGLGYIDGIMMTYNFRNMNTPKMEHAVAACVDAGIGLTAMKTQAQSSWRSMSKGEKAKEKLVETFIRKGFTEHQAKLKAVWRNPDIAAICSQMPNMTILKANVAAAVDTTPLTSEEADLFQQYAQATARQYCAGCGHICTAAVDGKVPIQDIMRYHMYAQAYGKPDWARDHFKALPKQVRQQISQIDYRAAQQRCPQNLPIAALMQSALEMFG